MKPRNLNKVMREVEALRDAKGKPVDLKIKPLVIGLRRWGLETKASCEGHLDHGRPYPWVDVPYNYSRRLARVVAWQNRPALPDGKPNENIWVIRPGASLRLMPEDKNRPLEAMQKDAEDFGRFLQELPDDWGRS